MRSPKERTEQRTEVQGLAPGVSTLKSRKSEEATDTTSVPWEGNRRSRVTSCFEAKAVTARPNADESRKGDDPLDPAKCPGP